MSSGNEKTEYSPSVAENRDEPENINKKSKLVWSILFLVIAAGSIYAITAQSRDFSVDRFMSYLSNASPVWLIAAVLCMLGYIFFEGLSLKTLCNGFGYKRKTRQGFAYSAVDIYVSAITPSATGGQPAAAYFMVKGGIPLTAATAILLINIFMYTLSLFFIGLLCIVLFPSVFAQFGVVSRTIVCIGSCLLVALMCVNLLMLFHERLISKICNGTLSLLHRLRIVKNKEEKAEKLNVTLGEYKQCADVLKKNKSLIFATLGYNMLQRIMQVSVSLFAYLAIGGSPAYLPSILSTQSLTLLGAYCIPIPGAMGVTDYLLVDGFQGVMSELDAVNFELLSRSISFYCCIFICGITTMLYYFITKKRRTLK